MFGMLKATEVLGSDESVVRETSNAYDYRGRRISHIENEDETQYSYGDGVSVLETKDSKTTLFYRGSDQGGGVGGINYAEYSDGSELNYKIYNLRGDVIFTLDGEIRRSSSTYYYEFGKSEQLNGDIKTDRHRANTKVEDSGNLLNEGKRFRQLEYGIFLTPDPLEYVDGYNPYIYCGQNPWGKWDPLGLAELEAYLQYVAINDPTRKEKCKAGYTADKLEFGLGVGFRAKDLEPGETYILALEVNATQKGAGSDINKAPQVFYFELAADKNKVADFDKSGAIGGDSASLYEFKGDLIEFNVEYKATLYKGDLLSYFLKNGTPNEKYRVDYSDFLGVKDGKPIYSSNSTYGQDGVYGVLLSLVAAHAFGSNGANVNTPEDHDKGVGPGIASLRAKARLTYDRKSEENKATLSLKNISGTTSSSEGRGNVTIEQE